MEKPMGVLAATALLSAMLAQAVGAGTNAEAFNALDTDGNGLLTPQEAATNSALADAFEDGDLNDDGQLDMTEFEKLEISDE